MFNFLYTDRSQLSLHSSTQIYPNSTISPSTKPVYCNACRLNGGDNLFTNRVTATADMGPQHYLDLGWNTVSHRAQLLDTLHGNILCYATPPCMHHAHRTWGCTQNWNAIRHLHAKKNVWRRCDHSIGSDNILFDTTGTKYLYNL
jgi:hypothetical protein